jgi:hypothetical protein
LPQIFDILIETPNEKAVVMRAFYKMTIPGTPKFQTMKQMNLKYVGIVNNKKRKQYIPEPRFFVSFNFLFIPK